MLGPYANGDKFRLVVCEGGGRKSVVVTTRDEAQRVKEQIACMLGARPRLTIGEALAEYLGEKQQHGAVSSTIATLSYKLGQFLPGATALVELTPARAEQLYRDETTRCGRSGRPVAAATHRGLLRSAKGLFRWAVERGYLDRNPFDGVRPVGRVNVGKAQLRIDEARRLCAVLLEHAETDAGAVAVLLQLMLGLRSSEVLQRKVRDVDDGGRVLWIPGGKTRNARRRLLVPELLQPLLLRLTAAAPPERSLICGEPGRAPGPDFLRHRVHRYCELAGVPRVCPHSLRGLHSTLALEAGATSGAVAAALGHGSFAVTARHYADPDTLRNTTVRRVGEALHQAPPRRPPPALSTAGLVEALRRLPPAELAAVLAAVGASCGARRPGGEMDAALGPGSQAAPACRAACRAACRTAAPRRA